MRSRPYSNAAVEVVADLGDVPGDDLGEVGELVRERRRTAAPPRARRTPGPAPPRPPRPPPRSRTGGSSPGGRSRRCRRPGRSRPGSSSRSRSRPRRRQPRTASWSRRLAGPGLVRDSIRPTAQRWRLSTSRVEIARRRIAVFQSTSVVGSSISPKTMSTIPSRSSSLFGHVVVERHRAGAELVGELAHRQRLDPVARRRARRRRAARAPCSAALAARWLVPIWPSASTVCPT